MKNPFFLCSLAFAAAMSSAPVAAQNLYVEVGAGRSRASVDCTGTSACDRSGSFVRGILGYEFMPNWALEVSLADLGRVNASGSLAGGGTVQTSAKLRSAGIGVAGSLPLSDSFALIGRLGVASNKTSVRGTAMGASVNDSERHTAAYVGMALNYALSQTSSVGLTVDRTQAEFDGSKSTVVAVGVGARFRF